MSSPSRPSRPEIRFQHPAFGDLYARVLADVAEHKLEPAAREAAARALAFLLREQVPTERVLADVLTAVHRSLDVPRAVRTLLRGLRDAPGRRGRIMEWTRRTAERALAERHVPSFVVAMQALVGLRCYDGSLPAEWQSSLVGAFDAPGLVRAWVFCLAKEYAERFGDEHAWVRTIRERCAAGGLHAPPDGGARGEG